MKRRAIYVALTLSVAGCAKKAAMPTSAPQMDAAASMPSSPQTLEELEAELDTWSMQLERDREDGVAAESARAEEHRHAEGRATSAPETHCERVMRIQDSICELGTRICELAEDHANESRYVRVCERATRACERASEAPQGCAKD